MPAPQTVPPSPPVKDLFDSGEDGYSTASMQLYDVYVGDDKLTLNVGWVKGGVLFNIDGAAPSGGW